MKLKTKRDMDEDEDGLKAPTPSSEHHLVSGQVSKTVPHSTYLKELGPNSQKGAQKTTIFAFWPFWAPKRPPRRLSPKRKS